jgi:spore coat polysaccharide biosynthesis protein SpsF
MILAVLDARAACPRLAAALLSPILGEPMIWRQIERVRRARTVSKLEVLLTDQARDDNLAGFLLGRGVAVRRDGQIDDPALWGSTHIALLKADQPLIDPRMIDETAALAARTGAAVTFGADQVEIVSADAFARTLTKPEARLPGRFPEWKVQTTGDFAFVRAVFQALHPGDPEFGTEEILELIERRPDLAPTAAPVRVAAAA